MSGPILHKIMHHPMAGKVMAGALENRLGGAPWSPADLFDAGQAGAFFYPTAADAFQDAGETIPSSGYESPVRVVKDLSGNGNDYVAPNDAARTAVHSIDGKVYARFNSLGPSEMENDAVATAYNGDFTEAWVFWQAVVNTSGLSDFISSPINSANANAFHGLAVYSSTLRAWWRGAGTTNQNISLGDQHMMPRSVVLVRDNTAKTVDIYLDGVLVADGVSYGTLAGGFNQFALGIRAAIATSAYSGGIAAHMVISEQVAGDDLTNLIDWCEAQRPAAQTVDVFLVAGQSNAIGRGISTSDRVPASGGFEYVADLASTSQNSGLKDLTDPLVEGEGFGSAWPQFAKTYEAATGRKAIIVQAAVGSTALLAAADTSQGNWSSTGTLRAAAVSYINELISQMSADNHLTLGQTFVLWSQGENEATQVNGTTITGALYEAELEALATYFNANITGGIDRMLVSALGAKVSDPSDADWAEIRDAQSAAATDSALIDIGFSGAAAFATSGKMEDDVHYNQIGLNEMGAGLATFAATI
jgi:hypothetical protein